MKKLAIFASGAGTNAENIHKFFSRGNRIGVDIVIYDRKDAGVAERMAQYGVETLYIPASKWRDNPEEIVELLQSRGIDMVVLAGFLRMVPDCVTEAYSKRIINIHPSLLPAYGGKGMYGHNVHKAVIEAGEEKSGVTVHYVTPVCDAGEIVMQQEVEIEPGETAESLESKIHDVEYSLYPMAIVKAFDALNTPPPVPPAKEWAETLGVQYRPELLDDAEGAGMEHCGGTGINGVGAGTGRYNASAGCVGSGVGVPLPPPTHMVSGNIEEAMPPTHLIWSVLCTICCCFIPGIVAIIMSSKVSSRYYAGDIDGAKRASRAAEWWIIASFVLGVMSATLYVPISMITF